MRRVARGEGEAEGCAGGWGTGKVDRSAVSFDDVFYDGEAEACTGRSGGDGDAEEFFEDSVVVLLTRY